MINRRITMEAGGMSFAPGVMRSELQVPDGAVLQAPGYKPLADIFARAFKQASEGKGKQRHAQDDKPFDKQPMQVICEQVGVGFATGQAIKKTEEGLSLPHDAKIAELLGAMVYLAGAVLFLESQHKAAPPEAVAHARFAPGYVGSVIQCPACNVRVRVA